MSSQPSIPEHLLLDHDILNDPDPFYHRLIDEAPVWRVGDSAVYTINSYEAVTEACKRVEDFSSNLRYFLYRDNSGLPARLPHNMADDNMQFLATADPPLHAQHKKIISPSFSPHRIASLETELVEMTKRRLAEGLHSGHMEFMSQLANMIPIDIVSRLIGFKQSNTEALFRAAIVQTDMLASAISKETLKERMAFTDETGLWVYQQFEEEQKAPGEGILGDLAKGVNQGEIDLMAAMAILLTLFAAGGESTSSLIGNATHMLAADKDLQQRLRECPELIPKFIEEALRLESPFRHHMRWVKKTTELCGVEIEEGATLLLMWGAANRDPAVFDRPDEIDLDRPRRHVAFGSGIHVCLGNTLARLEARVILETLLKQTREFELDATKQAEQVPSLAVRRLASLPLILTSK